MHFCPTKKVDYIVIKQAHEIILLNQNGPYCDHNLFGIFVKSPAKRRSDQHPA